MKRKLKKYILILILLMSLFLYMYCQNTSLQVTTYEIIDNKIPNNFNNFKIVQVSDYHNTTSKRLNNALLKEIKKQNPNIIVITGDLIDSSNTDITSAINFIKNIKDISPIYYVTGNHETWIGSYPELKEKLEKNNVIILENEKVVINKGNDKINLIGIEDSIARFIAENNINKSEYQKNEYNILLSHRPELFDLYVEYQINLVFTGHAHGGLIRIPYIGGLIAPDQGIFPKYTDGIMNSNVTSMIISRGIGNSVLPLRINNHPELVVVTLRNK